ncbi:MAG: hypothetical protein J0M35_00710 [Candidatus Obscuribacter phosphatis]|uniref:Uncharacterized protein n=1 Tax=Candidatus Obscuribacter phosphatis TaxID=1906157 RepID=A0A8J7PBJ6_9BACT|nr:hypothetical protein [Candidatus Obscuribacter phosphatis]
MTKRRNIRKERGSIITFATILALTLVVLGSAFLFFVLFMGGQKETKNAVDAGILNAGKQALDKISVPLPAGPASTFADITTDRAANYLIGDGQINLRRVNRMWGKAMLMAINIQAMQAEGTAGSGQGNVSNAFSEAQQTSDALAKELMKQERLHQFFQDVAGQNSVRMLGNGAQIKVKAGSNWETSLLDRGCESNIVLNGGPPLFNLPPGYVLPNNYYTQCTRPNPPADAAKLYFLKGYTPLLVNDKTFWQVPFKFDDKPHLVARSTFDANTMKNQPLNWNFAVPNAFSGEGEAVKNGPTEKAMSWMLTNPREPFQLAMPHSFVKIHVDENKSHWFFYPGGPPPLPDTEFGIAQTYGYTTETQSSSMPGGGLLCTTVSAMSVLLGTDVVGRSLDGIIFGLPEGNTTAVENYLTNRCNEMISVTGHSVGVNQVHQALSNPVTIGALIAGVRDFYLYSPDGMSLKCNPAPLAIAESPWLATMISNNPDGSEKLVIDEASMPAPIFFVPTVVPAPFCSPKLALGWGLWKKDVAWQPGTGYNGCLGQIRVKRWTNVHALGVCSFP